MRLSTAPLIGGVGLLGLAWFGPLSTWAHHSFAGHMAAHMTVVGLAAPLLALGLAEPLARIEAHARGLFSPIVASSVEMVTVWGWHAPGPHGAARGSPEIFAIEQGMFLVAGLLVWASALPTDDTRAAGGVFTLLFTSMHMTLLGALILLSPRILYHHAMTIQDQQMGGTIMLAVGGAVYLAGGLALMARLLKVGPA